MFSVTSWICFIMETPRNDSECYLGKKLHSIDSYITSFSIRLIHIAVVYVVLINETPKHLVYERLYFDDDS